MTIGFCLPFFFFYYIASTNSLLADSTKRAVIQEGLRLSFGVLTRFPRVAPFEALNYKGHIIPPGVGVVQCPI